MKRFAFVMMAVVFCVAADDAKKDQDKIKGKWKVEKMERGGMEIDQIKDADLWVAFDGDKMTVSFNGQEFEGKFKLDGAKKPKSLDSEFNGEERLGIYELDGDTLKICFGEPGEDRPKEFKTADGSRSVFAVYKREKKKE